MQWFGHAPEWSADEDKILIRAFRDELKSYGQISKMLGNRSRGAVAGRIETLRQKGKLPWPNVDGSPRLAVQRQAARAPKPKRHRTQPDITRNRPKIVPDEALLSPHRPKGPPAIVLNDGAHVTMRTLEAGMCKYPHGEVGTAVFHFCAHETDGGSWCAFHQTRVFNPDAAQRISADARACAADTDLQRRNNRIFT